jgi:hypothetical protein
MTPWARRLNRKKCTDAMYQNIPGKYRQDPTCHVTAQRGNIFGDDCFGHIILNKFPGKTRNNVYSLLGCFRNLRAIFKFSASAYDDVSAFLLRHKKAKFSGLGLTGYTFTLVPFFCFIFFNLTGV